MKDRPDSCFKEGRDIALLWKGLGGGWRSWRFAEQSKDRNGTGGNGKGGFECMHCAGVSSELFSWLNGLGF